MLNLLRGNNLIRIINMLPWNYGGNAVDPAGNIKEVSVKGIHKSHTVVHGGSFSRGASSPPFYRRFINDYSCADR